MVSMARVITVPRELLVAQQQTPAARKLVCSYVGIGAPAFPYDVPLRGGGVVRLFGRGESKVFWQIFVRRCYRLWKDCQTIVDAGANIGLFSLWAARQLPQARIFALEPFPETFARLQHNLSVNQLGDRVTALRLALAAKSGEREMLTEAESQQRRLVASDRSGAEGKVVKVLATSLNDLLDRCQLDQIDLLKMDIEGSEWEVLLSTPAGSLRKIRRLQFEYHEVHARFGYSMEGLLAHLRSAGLNLTHCRADKHGTGIAVVERGIDPMPVPGRCCSSVL